MFGMKLYIVRVIILFQLVGLVSCSTLFEILPSGHGPCRQLRHEDEIIQIQRVFLSNNGSSALLLALLRDGRSGLISSDDVFSTIKNSDIRFRFGRRVNGLAAKASLAQDFQRFFFADHTFAKIGLLDLGALDTALTPHSVAEPYSIHEFPSGLAILGDDLQGQFVGYSRSDIQLLPFSVPTVRFHIEGLGDGRVWLVYLLSKEYVVLKGVNEPLGKAYQIPVPQMLEGVQILRLSYPDNRLILATLGYDSKTFGQVLTIHTVDPDTGGISQVSSRVPGDPILTGTFELVGDSLKLLQVIEVSDRLEVGYWQVEGEEYPVMNWKRLESLDVRGRKVHQVESAGEEIIMHQVAHEFPKLGYYICRL